MALKVYLGKGYEDFSYLDHPIRLAPQRYAWSCPRPARPSPTLLLLGCHLPLLQGSKRLSLIKHTRHKVRSTQSTFNAWKPN